MQQTKSYWRYVIGLGVVSALAGAACTVTTSPDDGTSGAAGEGLAGAPGAAAGTAGASAGAPTSAGTGGSVGLTGPGDDSGFQCDTGDGGAPPGTPNVCTPDDTHMGDACQLCVQAHCCTEYSECFATDPGNQCGYGGPNDGGEIFCFLDCLHAGLATSGDDADLRAMCYGQCATNPTNHGSQDCGALVGNQTNALVGCLSDNCLDDCLGG